jgi:nucleoside 2-deoxyribosyltransferase
LGEIQDLGQEVEVAVKPVYLCGPINGCTDEECRDWRAAAKLVIEDVVDPMVRDYRGRETECFKEIVEGDKKDIDTCNSLLVNYDRPSVGTSMEIFYAWERGKYIVVVAKAGTVISPWLRYHSSEIVDTFARAFELLRL